MKSQRFLVSLVLIAVFIFGLVGDPTQFSALASPGSQTPAALPTELFFSEYVEGSSFNKALEIYNGTGSAVDLSVYSVALYSNGAAAPSATVTLSGSLAAGDTFVMANPGAVSAILTVADLTSGTVVNFNGDDAVSLLNNSVLVDVIGQIGTDPGTEWGAGVTSTADNTIRRKGSVCAGDPIGSDAFDPSLDWDGYALDTFDGLGAHSTTCTAGDSAPSVLSSIPSNGATQVPLNSNIDITFSEAVNVTGTWFDLTCATSGSHTAVVSGGPSTFTLDPVSNFTTGESCTLTVYAANVADQDTDDPPDNMAANFTSSFTTYVDVCTLSFTPIYSIQGSGLSAAITGNVTTQGVVVGDFETSSSASGFYIQDPVGDANAATSDGIFVYTGSNDFAAPGQLVRITGYARERFNQTTLNGSNSNTAVVPLNNIVVCGSGSIIPTVVTMPFASSTTPEQYEGMLVTFPQELVIAEYFNFDRFGEIVLGLPFPGQSRLFSPTSVVEPGAAAVARAAENALRRITLDDANSAQNPVILRHPDGSPFSLTNMFRGGDLVQNVVGVLGYDFSLYRVFPIAPADVTLVNTRPAAPEVVGGRIKISAMNTLNYFVTLDYPTGDPLDNKCGPQLTLECRGADSDQPLEFTRQRDKLLAALSGLDAAVIGLNEIENTTGVEPLVDIVAGLNDILGAGTYAYINTGAIGTDAIKVGMIYKPGEVTPVGVFKLLTTSVDPRFLDNLNRPALAQTFEENSTGARFTVVVNHLKSKSSPCDTVGDPDTGDGQGNCNQTRLAAAQALVDWLATDPTGSGDPDFIIMGDLNSYAMEDPIDAIKLGPDDLAGTADDYTNLIFDYHGLYAYSYVFDGQNGYLDHALANASMAGQVTGITDWHINADESDVLDYDTTFKPPEQENIYEPNAYRTSDHDPVLAGVNLDFADLELAMSESSDPVLPGQIYTYTITVTNTGTILAPEVWVSDTLPTGAGFVSMTSSQGTCDQALRTCNLGGIAAGGQATVKVTLRAPMTPGLVSNLARTGASIYELQANNSVSITTFVKYIILMPIFFSP